MAIILAAGAEPLPGYTLIEQLGTGGFGEVWKARAPGGIPKAIKFVKGSLDDIAEGRVAAQQELKSLNRVKEVRHPFILGLERVDVVDGQLMIVMELADKDLMKRLDECRGQGKPGVPRSELIRHMEETAEALDLMNIECQLQHLDIKPQNLFLVHGHIKVADFGLVKDLEGMTATITAGITPIYASPETFEGKASRSSDQYSLAIVYQELLTGVRPYVGKNARQLLMEHMRGQPNLEPLPPGDRAAVARALSKVPTERFPTCAEFVACLRKASPSSTSIPLPALAKAAASSAAKSPEKAPPAAPRWGRSSVADFSLFDSDGKKASKADAKPDKKDGTEDTVSITPAAKAPTVKIDPPAKPAKVAPKAKVVKEKPRNTHSAECPRCGAMLIDPGPFGWCGNCGYCVEVEQQNTIRKHDWAANRASWRWVILGAVAVLGTVILADGVAAVMARPHAMGSWLSLSLGAATLIGAGVAISVLWPGKLKQKRKRTTMVRRKLPPP